MSDLSKDFWEAQERELEKTLLTHLLASATDSARSMESELGVTVSDDSIKRWATNRAKIASKIITETSKDKVSSGTGDIEAFLSESRAMMVALTESVYASTAGTILAFDEAGISEGTITVAPDACPICEPHSDQIVNVHKDELPPYHPGCQCYLGV